MWSGVMGSCEVHKRLEGDLLPRQVKYCRLCDAWMCEECWWSVLRRVMAAVGQNGVKA